MQITKISVTLFFSFLISIGIAQIPQADLVGYWPFDGDADEYFFGENNGTLHGVSLTTDRCGNDNNAFSFDGNDYIICSTDSMGITDEVSISCWIKKNNGSTDIAVSKYSDQEADTGYNIQFGINGAAQIRGRDRNEAFSESGNDGVSLLDNEWYHLVGIVNGSIWSIYVDTILVGEYDNGHSSVFIGGSKNPLSFGRRAYFEPLLETWNYYDGILDDIAIYKRAISKEEVVQLFQNDCSPVTNVKDRANLFEFQIYPNPTLDGIVRINTSEKIEEISISDVFGRRIQAKSGYNSIEKTINLSGLPTGTYFLNVEFESHNLVQKIILL